MATHRRWLVINYRGDMRLVKTSPALDQNEVGFVLTVTIPDRKKTAMQDIAIELPQLTEPHFEVMLGEVQI